MHSYRFRYEILYWQLNRTWMSGKLNFLSNSNCDKTNRWVNGHLGLDLSLPIAAYIRQWIGSVVVQIMACRLSGAKPLSGPILVIINWTLKNKFHLNIKVHCFFIKKNVLQYIVHEMAAILSRGRWVELILSIYLQIVDYGLPLPNCILYINRPVIPEDPFRCGVLIYLQVQIDSTIIFCMPQSSIIGHLKMGGIKHSGKKHGYII